MRYSLPPDIPSFIGRDKGTELVTSTGTICAIDGLPGLGKTTLAIHCAHLLRPRFPDRQLFIDLHGHTPGREPVPEAALAGLLTAVGVDARSLPASPEGRVALWRDQMAGQKALLVLDNAASSDQVVPLLPGGDGWLVLVTSRRYLGDLPGTTIPILLDTLSPDQGRRCSSAWPPVQRRRQPNAWRNWSGWPGACPWRSRCWPGYSPGTPAGAWPT